MPWLSADSLLSFAKETTPGTVIDRSGDNYNNVFGITSRDVQLPDRQVQARPVPSFGVGRRYAQVIKGPHSYSGSIPFTPLSGESIYWAFGEDTYSNAGDADAATNIHTLTTRDGFGLPSISLLGLLKDTGGSRPFQRTFPGTVCSSMSLSAQAGAELQGEANIMAFKPVDWDTVSTSAGMYGGASSYAPDVTTKRPYQWFDVPGASDITIGSVSIGKLEEFSLRLDNRLQAKHYFGSDAEPSEYITRIPQFSFSGRMTPDGVTESSDALYKTLMDVNTVDFKILLQRGTNDSIQIVVEDALLTQAGHPLRGDGEEVVASFQLQPRDVKVIVKDDVTTDYASGWS